MPAAGQNGAMLNPILKCQICERALDQAADPLSIDCGGDCWGCIGEMEAEMGDEHSLQRVWECMISQYIQRTLFFGS